MVLKEQLIWINIKTNIKTFAQNRYLNHLINQGLQGVNRFFVLSFENGNDRTSHSTYYPKVEIKDYIAMIDGKNFFDQPINSMTKVYENIRKIAIADDYTRGWLYNWLLVRLSLFQRSLSINCNRFK